MNCHQLGLDYVGGSVAEILVTESSVTAVDALTKAGWSPLMRAAWLRNHFPSG